MGYKSEPPPLLERVEREGRELAAVALVELVLELDPVEAEGVEEGGEQLHPAEDADGGGGSPTTLPMLQAPRSHRRKKYLVGRKPLTYLRRCST